MNKAVLVVSFGTSYKETRDKTIGACEKKIHDCLSDYDFYHAYTSDKIIEKIKIKDGIHIDTPKQSLENGGKPEISHFLTSDYTTNL